MRTIAAIAPLFGAMPARADEPSPPLAIETRLTTGIVGIVQGASPGTRARANLDIAADADLDGLVGWHGARAKLHILANDGGHPNDLAGTLQGIDNIEAAQGRTKLYQAWIEQDLFGGHAALLLGLADLNADFYQNDSAGLLLAPAFGIGSELAATGPNGPSIFPSTALTARLRLAPRPDLYVKAAVIGAKSGVPGDPGGVDFALRDGVLLIGETGWTGHGKIALGYWHYSKRQDDIRDTAADGTPIGRIAHGAYLLVDQPFSMGRGGGNDGPSASAFMRIGISDAATTPFSGGWQVGVMVDRPFVARPDGQLSIGLNGGHLSRRYRANAADAGQRLTASEIGFEMTYADRLAPWLRFQPDVQYVIHPAGDRAAPPAIILGLRLVFTANKTFERR